MSDTSFTLHKIKDLISGYMSGPSPTCEERQIASAEEWGLLKTTAVTWNGWDQTAHKVPPEEYWGNHRIEVKAGDVLVTKAGPRHRVGVVVYVDKTPPRLMVSGKMIGLRPDPKKVNYKVLAAALSQYGPQRFLDSRTTGMADSQLNFTNELLLNTEVLLPPKPEQTKIAELISTLDQAIEQTEALIAKQHRIKTGLMQDLLTRGIDEHGNLRSEQTHKFKDSKTLLGRIPIEWEVTDWGSVGYWKGGSTPSKGDPKNWLDGKNLWVSPKDIRAAILDTTEDLLTDRALTVTKLHVFQAGSIFTVFRSGILKHTIPISTCSKAFSVNQDIKVLIPKSDTNIKFLKHLLSYCSSDILRTAVKAGTTVESIDRLVFEGMKIPRPDLREQTHISVVLDQQESMSNTLKNELLKLRPLKTALMQDLLTGKKRVTPLLTKPQEAGE